MKVALALAFLVAAVAPMADLTVGGDVPDLKLKAVDGKECSVHELNKAGKVVVLVSWSKDCPTNALGRVNEVAAKYKDNAKVAFIGVNAFGKETAEAITAYLKDNNCGYPVVFDSDKSCSKALGAKKVNMAYVISGCKLFWRGAAVKGGKDSFVDAIEAALGGKPAPASDKEKAG